MTTTFGVYLKLIILQPCRYRNSSSRGHPIKMVFGADSTPDAGQQDILQERKRLSSPFACSSSHDRPFHATSESTMVSAMRRGIGPDIEPDRSQRTDNFLLDYISNNRRSRRESAAERPDSTAILHAKFANQATSSDPLRSLWCRISRLSSSSTPTPDGQSREYNL